MCSSDLKAYKSRREQVHEARPFLLQDLQRILKNRAYIAEKEINKGKIVTAFMMGTRRLYDFVDDNPMVEMRPVDYTNDTAVIRRLRRMTAINSAIEIDLTGQVCADSIGPRFYSGIGGQMDFVRGAALAEEGRAIIALPSTALDGRQSRIVPFLREGAGVVTSRGHVQTVVTEWGVAHLHEIGRAHV